MSRTVLSAHAIAEEMLKLIQSATGGVLIDSTSLTAAAIGDNMDTATFEVHSLLPKPKGLQHPSRHPTPSASYRVLVVRTEYVDPAEDE